MGKKIFYYGAPVIGRFPSFLHVTQEDNDDICFAIGSDGKVQTIALDVMTFSLLIDEMTRLGIIPQSNWESNRWSRFFKKKPRQKRKKHPVTDPSRKDR
jgi:hypothetical protein